MTVAVVIPALNEEGNIGRLVQETFRVIPPEILSEVIVIVVSKEGKVRALAVLRQRSIHKNNPVSKPTVLMIPA